MNKLTCAIIDDEPLARALLESYVKKTSILELKGEYNNASSAIHNLTTNPVNLVFLDIQMPDMDGIQFSRMLPSETRVIFTTAFSEYAVDGYRINALDYLKKPINYSEFMESINKAIKWFMYQEGRTPGRNNVINQEDTCDFFYVKSDYKMVRFRFDEILYIEGLKDYLKIYLENDKQPLMTLLSMKTMESRLPSPRFLRIHRSYIVQMSKVTNINKTIINIGDIQLPVSDGYREEVQKFVNQHSL